MSRLFSPPSFAAGVVIGALLAGAWFFRDGLTLGAPRLAQNPPSSGELQSSTSGAVSVADQSAGDEVIVESLTVPPPGVWAAVREVNGKDLGNVLGARKVSAPATKIRIPLLRATEPGRRYAIELYRDDGNGEFNASVESVYVDFDTGERVVAYFETN